MWSIKTQQPKMSALCLLDVPGMFAQSQVTSNHWSPGLCVTRPSHAALK